uniref:Uncharacterized protein n=1 Tax=Avena sativa TaxID=4498 RepID=A0ACD5UVY9_AVESA
MDIIISAIVGDLISRSASFVVTKCFQQQPGIDKILQRLERVVLRIDIVIEEADGRAITNQGMLHQLRVLRQGMYRGRYTLDALRFQAALGEVEGEEEETSHTSSALSKSSSAKRLCFSRTRSGSTNREALLFGSNTREELQQMVNTLEHTMAVMKEFLFFLESYPRILRQPYGTYLILDNCMFGRQAERQRLLNFLLRPSATTDFAVLPIVGPIRVGKTTLVEHVCMDETVRDHFLMICFFPEGSLNDEGLIDLRKNNTKVRHQNCASENRSLIILEIADDINEGTWRRLKSSITSITPCGGSKVIITSRSDGISYTVLSLPDHSLGVGATTYNTSFVPRRAFKYEPAKVQTPFFITKLLTTTKHLPHAHVAIVMQVTKWLVGHNIQVKKSAN